MANPYQTLHQQHTAPKIGGVENLFLSSSLPNVTPISHSPAVTQISTISFVAMTKSVKIFDGLDHQYTPEKDLQQVAAYMVFTMG